MTLDAFGQLNWLAVVAAAVAYFAIGSIWYIPITPMGRAWASAIGFVSHPGAAGQPNPSIYALPMVGHVVSAAVTAVLARALEINTAGDGMVLGLFVWLGYAVPNWILAAVFNPHAKQPMTLIGLFSAHHLFGMLAVGAIVGAWL